jgi:hypothetical protein
MNRRLALALLPLLLAGCDQMRQEPVAELPPDMFRGAGDPARFAAESAAQAFLDREAALRGRPMEAAHAAAMVENASTAFQDQGRLTDAQHVTRLLREGRVALRQAIGLDLALAPQRVQDALFEAYRAFRRGDATAAETALAPVAARGARPAATLANLETPAPLRRALRETRAALARSVAPGA